MNREPKLSRWKGAEILEKDLPPGVTFYDTRRDCLFLSVPGGRYVCVLWYGDECLDTSCYRRGLAVCKVHDWPDHCGPLPDAKPTWKQIVEGAPNPRAQLVFDYDDGPYAGTMACAAVLRDDTPCRGFLGYLVWEPTE
jgi:hypothetical protein